MSRRIVACALPPGDYDRVLDAANAEGIPIARWIRRAVLAAVPKRPVGRPRTLKTWREVVEAMAANPPAAAGIFHSYAAGRALPPEMSEWELEAKIAWLEQEWPL